MIERKTQNQSKTNNIKYFIYGRRSQDSEDRQKASIPDQLASAQSIARKYGLQVVDTVTESRSAKSPGRPGFDDLVKRINAEEATGIITWDLDRLARNPIDGGQIIWMIQKGIIKHIRTYDSDYWPEDNTLIMQIKFGMANEYIRELGKNIKRGTTQKALRGWKPSAQLPVGYRHLSDLEQTQQGKEIGIDEERFHIIQSLWHKLMKQEYTVSDCWREAKRLNLTNPRSNKPYSISRFYQIFTDEFYCGYFTWLNQDGVSTRYSGKHPKMITEEAFDYTQLLLGKRGKLNRASTYSFPLRGHISCGECNGAITAERKMLAWCTNCKRKFSIRTQTHCRNCGLDISDLNKPKIVDKVYYHCAKRKKKCSQKYVEGNDLMAQANELLRTIQISADFTAWAKHELQYSQEQEISTQQSILAQLKAKETKQINQIDQLVHMRARQEVDEETFARLQKTSRKVLEDIQKEIRVRQSGEENWTEVAQDFLTFAQSASERFENGDDESKRSILNALGSNLMIKDKKLNVCLAKPLFCLKNSTMLKAAENDRFEPQKVVEKQGVLSDFQPLFPVWCSVLKQVRTAILNATPEERAQWHALQSLIKGWKEDLSSRTS